MSNSKPQSTTNFAAGKGPKAPPPEQIADADTQSEFSVEEARRESAEEQVDQQSAQRQDSASDDKKASVDTESEFSVDQRLREEK